MGGGPSRDSFSDADASIAFAPWSPLQAPAGFWGEASDARWRWAVNVGLWEPHGGAEGPEFQLLLGLLPEGEEREGVLKLPSFLDRKRRLVGRLLAQRACARALGESDFGGFVIGRTYGLKPFLRRPLPPHLPNFNFNVSHDGRWVVLASDPLRLVGVDVSAPQWIRGDKEDDSYLDELENIISLGEQRRIRRETTVLARYAIFQRIWSAKEAVAKAVGQGVDFGFQRIEVTLDGEDSAQWPAWVPCPGRRQVEEDRRETEVTIDMWPRPDWEIKQHQLPGGHWASVALGPVEEAEDQHREFSATLRLRCRGVAAYARRTSVSPPCFEVLSIDALVPKASVAAFEALRARP